MSISCSRSLNYTPLGPKYNFSINHGRNVTKAAPKGPLNKNDEIECLAWTIHMFCRTTSIWTLLMNFCGKANNQTVKLEGDGA